MLSLHQIRCAIKDQNGFNKRSCGRENGARAFTIAMLLAADVMQVSMLYNLPDLPKTPFGQYSLRLKRK
jgi:hypothetical protein